MSTLITQAVSEAVIRGYQIEPEAFALLNTLAGKMDAVKLVLDVIGRKKTQGTGYTISKVDLESALPQKLEEALVREPTESIPSEFEVIKDPTEKISPIEGTEGFHRLFKSRFEKLMKIVQQRPDSYRIQRIASLSKDRDETNVKVAGLMLERRMKRNSVKITIDDTTGKLDLVVLNDSAKKTATEGLMDQLLVADVSINRTGVAVAQSIYSPDLPDHRPNFSKQRVYVLLLSDLHVGSKTFLMDEFNRLIAWVCGEDGDKEIVSRIRYIVICGDAIDGVGVYPGQELDLLDLDVDKQYESLAQMLQRLPESVKIFITPGNHDPVRQALPQPAVPRSYAEGLYRMENVIMLGNPSEIRLSGVNVLIYHGKSVEDVIATSPGLTVSRPALAMKALLKARHLAPIYGRRTALAPEPEDNLVIENIPDVVHSGHMHVLDSERYKGVLLINSGTWQTQTAYQSNMGVSPTPGIATLVDLSTLDVVTKSFLTETPQE